MLGCRSRAIILSPVGAAENLPDKTMSHSYCSASFHIVFSTKDRRKLIDDALRDRLWPYIGGIARENGMNTSAVGGTVDHIHILLSLSSTIAISKAVQLIKGGSSKWIHDNFPSHQDFAWQEGYGAFSVSISGVRDTIDYIDRQEEHHRTRTFEEEFIAFLTATKSSTTRAMCSVEDRKPSCVPSGRSSLSRAGLP